METEKAEILKFSGLFSYEYLDELHSKLSIMICDNSFCDTFHQSNKKTASEMCELRAINKGDEISFKINTTCCNRFSIQIKHAKEIIFDKHRQFVIA